MKVLIDTNIILDYLLEREPFVEQADELVELLVENRISACVAAHTITNLFYILKKNMPLDKMRDVLQNLCGEFEIVGVDSAKIVSVLRNCTFQDLEDCLQDECAADFNAEYIITRNTKDFRSSKVKAVTPEEFLYLFRMQ